MQAYSTAWIPGSLDFVAMPSGTAGGLVTYMRFSSIVLCHRRVADSLPGRRSSERQPVGLGVVHHLEQHPIGLQLVEVLPHVVGRALARERPVGGRDLRQIAHGTRLVLLGQQPRAERRPRLGVPFHVDLHHHFLLPTHPPRPYPFRVCSHSRDGQQWVATTSACRPSANGSTTRTAPAGRTRSG